MVEVDSKVERERAIIFHERKTTVHISKIYDNPSWINGIILEVGEDFFIIKDRLNGKEYLVLFAELKKPIVIYGEVEQREDWE